MYLLEGVYAGGVKLPPLLPLLPLLLFLYVCGARVVKLMTHV